MINRLKENFTQVDNKVLNNKELSLKAKGLYAFLCSKPDDWQFNYNGLSSQLQEGEKAIRSAVKELVEQKILLRISKKENNKFIGWDWIINPSEKDLKDNTDPIGKHQNRKCPKRQVPKNGITINGNQISNTDLSNTDLSNTNKEIYRNSILEKYKGLENNVILSQEEINKIKDRFGIEVLNKYINNLSLYIAEKGDKYKSHYLTILKWINKDNVKEEIKINYENIF